MAARRLAELLLSALVATASLRAQPPELPPIGGGSAPNAPAPPPLPPPANGDAVPPMLPPLAVPPQTSGGAALGAPDAPPSRTIPPVGGEMELVERVVAARRAYAASLKELQEHYRLAGDEKRARLADDELKAFHRAPHAVYRIELDVPSPRLRPLYDQRGASDLYRWALSYKDKGFGSEYFDNMRRAELLLQELLTKYPQSTKISDAAYVLGDLYEGRAFRQFERAAAYYERCFQWDPNTPTDARLRAAQVHDRNLRDRTRAVELYREVVERDAVPTRRQEATRRLNELGAR